MATPDELLAQVPEKGSQTAPLPGPVTPSGAGQDELTKVTQASSPPDVSTLLGQTPDKGQEPAEPAEPAQPKQPGEPVPKEQRSFAETAQRSLARGIGQVPVQLKQIGAVAKEAMGEPEAAAASMREAQAEEQALPQPEWKASDVHDLTSAGYWLTERLGENGPAIAAMLATGGLGSVAASLATRGMANLATRAAIIHAGELGGTFAAAAPMATAGVAGEQFQVTGSTQPGISIPTGLAGGALQTYLPFKVLGALKGGGFSPTYAGSALKGAAIGAGAGTAQEALNIYARKLSDPNYSFFSDGPERQGWGERLWESGIANTVLGGLMGTAAHPFEHGAAKQTPFRPEPEDKEQPGGFREDLPPITPGEQEPSGGPPLPKWARGELGATSDERDQMAETREEGLTELHGKLSRGEVEPPMKLGGPKVKFTPEMAARPEAPPENTGATYPESGPITNLRRQVVRTPISPDRNLRESTMLSLRDDTFGAMPLLRDGIDTMMSHEAALDFMEANTKRYAIEDPSYPSGYVPRLVTDTDFERMGGDFPQSERPKLWEIDQGSLQPAALTADVMDLPHANHERIWFLPTVPEENKARLMQDYAYLADAAELLRPRAMIDRPTEIKVRQGIPGTVPGQRLEGLEHIYERIINEGLRVIPSRGSSFYYNGVFQGRRAEPLTTARSKQIAFLDPDTGVLNSTRMGTGHDRIYGSGQGELFTAPENIMTKLTAQGGLAGVPVAVDLNKFAPGEIMGIPNTLETKNIKFKDGLTRAEKQYLSDELVRLYQRSEIRPTDFREIMREGAWIPPGKDDAALITKEPLHLDKLVPGVARPDQAASASVRGEQIFRPDSQVWVSKRTVAPEHTELAEKIRAEAVKLMPVVDTIMERLGLGKLNVDIKESKSTAGSFGIALLNDGTIGLSPASFALDGGKFTPKKLADAVHWVIMHEVGHFVTWDSLRRLPTEVHSLLRYAYNRELAIARSDREMAQSRTSAMTDPGKFSPIPDYYRTFPEWLAEQFRRWSTSTEEPRTLMDRYYKEGAERLEKFYNEWNATSGALIAKNMLEPNYHFSAVMDYMRTFGHGGTMTAKQVQKSITLWRQNMDVRSNPASDAFIQAGPLRAIQEMAHMFPPGVQVELNKLLRPEYGEASPGAHGRTIPPAPGMWNFPLIEMALASLPRASDVGFSRIFFAHELVHTHRMMGLIHEGEFRLLERVAGEAKMSLGPAERAGIADRLRRQGETEGWSKEYTDYSIKEAHSEELVAQYIEQFANGEKYHPQAKSILQPILDLITKIGNYMRGEGFNTREQVLDRYFSGEMAHRPDRTAQRNEVLAEMSRRGNYADGPEIRPDKITQVEGKPTLWAVSQDLGGTLGIPNYNQKVYKFYDMAHPPTGDLAKDSALIQGEPVTGWIHLVQDGIKGWDVRMIRTNEKQYGMAQTMMRHWENDLGTTAKPSGNLTAKGYMMAKMRWREEMKHYIFSEADGTWYSPNFIKDQVDTWRGRDKELDAHWTGLYNRVPKETWSNPILSQMFMLPKNPMRDAVQQSIINAAKSHDQANMQGSMGSSSSIAPDPFTQSMDMAKQNSQARAARELGVPYSLAAPRMPTMEMASIFRRISQTVERVEGYREPPEISKKLTGILNESDRIGWFTKRWWDILQLGWNNEHIEGLRNYIGSLKEWAKDVAHWQSRADETVRTWRELSDARREVLNDTLFWLSEGSYRTANERTAGVERMPTSRELAAELARQKFTPEETKLLTRISDDHAAFLRAAENQMIERVRRSINDPARFAVAAAKIRAEMAQLRQKPYFPMTRFGRWTTAVRDLAHPENPVIASYAYDTRAQRDAALAQIRAKYPSQKVTYGTVPEHSAEFMGLPGPLLRVIKDELPGISPDQRQWIEEFELLHAPDKTFRRRWLPQNGLPGYSMDAMRAYSSFFLTGSSYLARLKHAPEMQDAIRQVDESVRTTPFTNTGKRQEILKYMQDHHAYMMESGKDWGKTKAFISLWQLGFSPAAAFTNLTQTPLTTFPHLMGTFGNEVGFKSFMKSLDFNFKPMGQFDKARTEMVSEGLIDAGQAADLAMYAEGHNLLKSMAGSKAQQIWQEFSRGGMWMFQKAEQFNRDTTLKAAWTAAMENPNNARVQEVAKLYPKEMSDLVTRVGLTDPEAAAYLFAKETIEKTQFTFAKWNRPPFLRNQLSQVALIFFKYTQNMMELYRISPGRMQMAMMQAALFGLAGMPLAEDLNQVMKSTSHVGIWLLRKLGINIFGGDFDLLDKAREYAREVTEGTMFDQKGPDLFLHGISRYGFGMGLLPEGMALGQFDASQNGSLGRVIPAGIPELMKGLTSGDYKNAVTDMTAKAAGAGYGWIFTLMKYMNENPGTADSKTWESLLPRAGRAGARAYRFATEGLTTNQGGRLVKFDMQDPEDFSAILAQAGGFTPTKVAQFQEYNQALQEQLKTYQAEKTMLYGQLDKAVTLNNQGAINDTIKAINDYNAQVVQVDPSQAIKTQGLMTSIRGRIKMRAMQTALEQSGQVNRSTIPVAERIRKNYPDVPSPQRVP